MAFVFINTMEYVFYFLEYLFICLYAIGILTGTLEQQIGNQIYYKYLMRK